MLLILIWNHFISDLSQHRVQGTKTQSSGYQQSTSIYQANNRPTPGQVLLEARQQWWWAQLFYFAPVVDFFVCSNRNPFHVVCRWRHSSRSLGRSSPNFDTCSTVTLIYKIGSLPKKIWRPKNIKLWTKFRTTSQVDREYPRNETRHRRTKNGSTKYKLKISLAYAYLIWWTLLYKWRKIIIQVLQDRSFERPNALALRVGFSSRTKEVNMLHSLTEWQ